VSVNIDRQHALAIHYNRPGKITLQRIRVACRLRCIGAVTPGSTAYEADSGTGYQRSLKKFATAGS
jgi:hypothetical protein